MHRSSGISRRWMVNNLSVVAAVVLAIMAVLDIVVANYYYSSMQSSLKAKLRTTTAFFEGYTISTSQEFYSAIYDYIENFEDRTTLEIELLSPSGEIMASSLGLVSGTNRNTADVQDAVKNGTVSAFRGRDPDTKEHILSVAQSISSGDGQASGVLRIVTSLKTADRRIFWLVLCFSGVAVAILLLIWATGQYFIRSIVHPVSDITQTAQRLAAGSYGVQIPQQIAGQDDEIGHLASAINNVSLQISQTEKMQTEFLSSVSHELRTPLTAIGGWAETLLSSDSLNAEDTRRGLSTILQETKRLTSLVEEILEFSRMQDGRFKVNLEKCDLRAVFEDTIFMYASRLRQENITLDYEESDDDIPEISCDPERMKQVFLNLLDNAAKYGGSGGKISCRMYFDKPQAQVVVEIRDYGPGIAEEDLPLVKKKFYRGPGNIRGNGIGLAVCEEIVTMHGGQLILENANDGQSGLQVTIHLPRGE